MKKKRKSKSVLKKLETTAENLWKEVCRLRDNQECQIANYFPELSDSNGNPIRHDSVLQVDHCFSRKNNEIFFDVKNGTLICRSCHFKKSKNLHGFSRLVDRIVLAREGAEWFTWAEGISVNLKPYIWDVIQLEQLIIRLKEQRADFLSVMREEN